LALKSIKYQYAIKTYRRGKMIKYLKVLLLGLTIGTSCLIASQNLSHTQRTSSFEQAKQNLIEKIKTRGDLPYISVKQQLELVDQLSEFELGRFMIERGGLNGYWTHYVVTYPEMKKDKSFHELESFILNSAPTCLAIQERYKIFKSQIKRHIHEGCSFASIPCGVMGEFLDLDYKNLIDFSLSGIDIDPETLAQAKEYAEKKKLSSHCHFFEKDAWALNLNNKFDLITSSGLSIYEPDDQKVVQLYVQFYNALKPNGVLIESFLTPPPFPGHVTEWLPSEFNPQDALMQKIVFMDVLDAKWQAYRTAETVKKQLQEAGFKEIVILYDKAHVFPTVVAKKS